MNERAEPGWIPPPGWELVSDSDLMRRRAHQAARWARTDSTVLLSGETGTGKSAIARAIHFMSDRRSEPFVSVNLAGLPKSLADSQLFGHTKGAFTGATQALAGAAKEAGKGTLFLDEIGDLAPDLQGKFLRLLEERKFRPLGGSKDEEFEARVIAATHRELLYDRDTSGAHRLRRDLYYRVAVLPLDVPPLRERPEDIPGIVQRFASDLNFTTEAIASLKERDWPGNVRELRHIVERIVAMHGPSATVQMREVTEAFGLTASAPPSPSDMMDVDDEVTALLQMAAYQPHWAALPIQERDGVIGIARLLPFAPSDLRGQLSGASFSRDPTREILARAYALALWRCYVNGALDDVSEVVGKKAVRREGAPPLQGRVYQLFAAMEEAALRESRLPVRTR
ncbi:MAG: sigma 54-interacting transcriptional regulator [Sandaracinaceae bacterium]